MHEAYEPKYKKYIEILTLPHSFSCMLLQPSLHPNIGLSRKTIETMMKFSNQYAKVELRSISETKPSQLLRKSSIAVFSCCFVGEMFLISFNCCFSFWNVHRWQRRNIVKISRCLQWSLSAWLFTRTEENDEKQKSQWCESSTTHHWIRVEKNRRRKP